MTYQRRRAITWARRAERFLSEAAVWTKSENLQQLNDYCNCTFSGYSGRMGLRDLEEAADKNCNRRYGVAPVHEERLRPRYRRRGGRRRRASPRRPSSTTSTRKKTSSSTRSTSAKGRARHRDQRTPARRVDPGRAATEPARGLRPYVQRGLRRLRAADRGVPCPSCQGARGHGSLHRNLGRHSPRRSSAATTSMQGSRPACSSASTGSSSSSHVSERLPDTMDLRRRDGSAPISSMHTSSSSAGSAISAPQAPRSVLR